MEPGRWEISVRGRANLLRTLGDRFQDALLYRRLATLDTTAPTITSVDELAWTGPRPGYDEALRAIDAKTAIPRIQRLVAAQGAIRSVRDSV